MSKEKKSKKSTKKKSEDANKAEEAYDFIQEIINERDKLVQKHLESKTKGCAYRPRSPLLDDSPSSFLLEGVRVPPGPLIPKKYRTVEFLKAKDQFLHDVKYTEMILRIFHRGKPRNSYIISEIIQEATIGFVPDQDFINYVTKVRDGVIVDPDRFIEEELKVRPKF